MPVAASIGSDRRAAAILEFTLILPLLLVLAAGVFDFGRAFALDVQLYQAVRAGGQMALADPSDAGGGIEAKVNATAPAGTTANAPSYKSVACTTTDATCSVGSVQGYIEISASVPFSALVIPLKTLRAAYVERYQ